MFFLGFVSRITFSCVEKYVYRFSCTSLCYEGPDQVEVVRKLRSKGKRLKSPVLPLHSRSPSRDGLHRSGSLSRSHSRSSSRSRSLLHRTADPGSDVFNVPLSKSRQVRKWVVQSLSNEKSKRLRSKYTPAFENQLLSDSTLLDGVETSLKLLGNAFASVSILRRCNTMRHVNPDLLPLLKDGRSFSSLASCLFNPLLVVTGIPALVLASFMAVLLLEATVAERRVVFMNSRIRGTQALSGNQLLSRFHRADPCKQLEYLGLLIDSILLSLPLPPGKVDAISKICLDSLGSGKSARVISRRSREIFLGTASPVVGSWEGFDGPRSRPINPH
ncbi:hypothetical protein OUZ56_021865 [Daphnia magna]|uniref:Uncharacterized protein n=1 Tax=Daphnia magna TaxID=35525 RepID=A0ABR0AUP1_9CRUS|nr:hypothetical protein OUZ56_021865 [Daphnia magna]